MKEVIEETKRHRAGIKKAFTVHIIVKRFYSGLVVLTYDDYIEMTLAFSISNPVPCSNGSYNR